VDAFLATVASRRGEEEPAEYHGSMPGPMARLRRFPRAPALCFPRPDVIEKVPPKGRVHVVRSLFATVADASIFIAKAPIKLTLLR
jgi:hypothetical protein